MKVTEELFLDLLNGRGRRVLMAFDWLLWITLIFISFNIVVGGTSIISITKVDALITYLIAGEYLVFVQWGVLIALAYFLLKWLLTTFLPYYDDLQNKLLRWILGKNRIPYIDVVRRGRFARKDNWDHVKMKLEDYTEEEVVDFIESLRVIVGILLKVIILSILTIGKVNSSIHWLPVSTIVVSVLLIVAIEFALVYSAGLRGLIRLVRG